MLFYNIWCSNFVLTILYHFLQWVFNVSSMNTLIGSFTRLISATVVTMPEAHQSEAREAFESLPAMLMSEKADMDANIHEALSHVSLTALFPEFGTIATRCMAAIKGCSSLVRHQGTLLKQFMLGEAWTYAGLLQSFLLAPQGPVDPAEKQFVKLVYFRQEVRILWYLSTLFYTLHWMMVAIGDVFMQMWYWR